MVLMLGTNRWGEEEMPCRLEHEQVKGEIPGKEEGVVALSWSIIESPLLCRGASHRIPLFAEFLLDFSEWW